MGMGHPIELIAVPEGLRRKLAGRFYPGDVLRACKYKNFNISRR
jgi:hypothetical protein